MYQTVSPVFMFSSPFSIGISHLRVDPKEDLTKAKLFCRNYSKSFICSIHALTAQEGGFVSISQKVKGIGCWIVGLVSPCVPPTLVYPLCTPVYLPVPLCTPVYLSVPPCTPELGVG